MAHPVQNKASPVQPSFLSEAELARRWLHSERTLQRWRQKGQGPAYLRLGRRVLYRLADVEAHEAAARFDAGREE